MSKLLLLASAGLGAESWKWTPTPAGLSVVFHEFPGHGSRPMTDGAYTLADLADEIAATYDEELHVVGVSMGGMVAQQLLVRHPEKVLSAFLACTGPKVDRRMMLERAAASAEGMTVELIETTLRRWFSAGAIARRPEHPGVAHVRHALASISPRAFAAAWAAIADHSLLDELGEVAVPVTCLAAESDPAAPPETVRLLAESIPRARFVSVAGPHLLQIERPSDFGDALVAHLDLVGVR